MTNTKLTYIDALTFAINVIDNAIVASGDGNWDQEAFAVIDKLTALKNQQIKRNSAERKPTKAQKENAGLAEDVREVLRNASEPLTISEIMGRSDALALLSNQKVSAVVRSMGAEVVKTTDKRVSKFALAV